MRKTRILAAALLITVLGTFNAAYAEDTGNTTPAAKGEWAHHHGGGWGILPEDKRKLLKDAMEKLHQQNAALHERKHQLHADLDAIIKAPEFDAGAYLKKSAELDALKEQMKQNKEKAFASVLAKFTQEERIELVVLHRIMKHRHHEGKWGHHDGSEHHNHDGNGIHAKERSNQPAAE